jgi:hypothetical protein
MSLKLDNVEFVRYCGGHYLPTYKILMISKWQTSRKILKCRIAPLMVTYHYVKLYVSIIIHLEVININVRNFNFPIGFYSNPHPLWTPQNITPPSFMKFCPVVPEICRELIIIIIIIIRRNGAKTISLQTLFGRLNYSHLICNIW